MRLLLPLLLLSSTPALAVGAGIFSASGENPRLHCQVCHRVVEPTPTFTVEGVVDALPGDSLFLTVRVRPAAEGGGVAAGFGLATSSAGTFVDPDAGLDDLRLGPNLGVDNQVTHTRPKRYDENGGEASWRVVLDDLQEGRHRIFAGGNDVDLDTGTTNDRAALLLLRFNVCDPAAEDGDADGATGLCDRCPDLFDPEQADSDDDGVGDPCDVCPDVADDQADADGDGAGDACDAITDDCALELDDCGDNTVCVDEDFRSFRCDCAAGYARLDEDAACLDIDECVAGADCIAGFTCRNTEGSFTCDDVDECLTNPCDPGFSCSNEAGAFSCDDVDECLSDPCEAGFSCTNEEGSFTCSDIDECADAPCGAGFTCTNSAGSFACVDVDECAGGGPCADDEQCTNTEGAFTCTKLPIDEQPEEEPKKKKQEPSCAAAPASSAAALLISLLAWRRRRPRR